MPERLFVCLDCGHVAPQSVWFPSFSLEINPVEEEITAESCEKCGRYPWSWNDTGEDESQTYPRLDLVPVKLSE